MASERAERIILGSCAPPALSGFIFFTYLFFLDPFPSYSPEWANRGVMEFIAGAPFVMLISLIFLIIPCMLYSLLMEFVVQKIDNDLVVILISACLGAYTAKFFGDKALIVGGIVGLMVGYVLRNSFKLNPPASD